MGAAAFSEVASIDYPIIDADADVYEPLHADQRVVAQSGGGLLAIIRSHRRMLERISTAVR